MDEGSPEFRAIPSVDALLRTEEGERLRRELAPAYVAAQARALVAAWREAVRSGALDAAGLALRVGRMGGELETAARAALEPTLKRVVNATGVVVHTNLGRAPWPASAAARALEVATRYSNLEYDLARGERGAREAHVHGARE